MADSIHFARWLSQFGDEHTFEIVSSSPHRRVHPVILARLRSADNVRMTGFSKFLSLPMWVLDRLCSDWIRGLFIAARINYFEPDLVHVHELQNAGYATRRAFQILRKKPRLVVTNYGSELVWFLSYKSHRNRLQALLSLADSFSAECKRDYALAKEISPGIHCLPLMPVAGGLATEEGETRRDFITVKGYENKWGKALFVINTLSEISEALAGKTLVIYSASLRVRRTASRIARQRGISLIVFRKGELTHSEVLSLFKRSIIFIGHSLSDGISTAMLESMSRGAIPVQTNSSCASEWVTDRKTGYLVEPLNGAELRRAVIDILNWPEVQLSQARSENFRVLRDRYDPATLSAVALSYYREAP